MSLARTRHRKKKRRHTPIAKGNAAHRRATERAGWFEQALAVCRARLFAEQPREFSQVRTKLLVGGGLLLAAFVWAYWSTFVELIHAWENEPDYSHGYLIIPIALYFLWARRESFPGWSSGVVWAGAVLIGLSIGMRYLGALWFLGPVDGWSIIPWVAGVVWILCGTRVLGWAMPSICFLILMVPMPYRAESLLSVPLQSVATKISTWSLQLLGQPAFAEGNVILLGDHRMQVEEACSGLRIFMGIIALAFAYVVVTRRTWWEKLFLVAAVLPIALVANATRIVVTGLLYQCVSGEAAKTFSHDLAGWVMIPFAAALFALCLGYLSLLFQEEEQADAASLARRTVG